MTEAVQVQEPVGLGLPSSKQRDSILDSNARINIWHGSVRSGKTVGSLIRYAVELKGHSYKRHLVLGKTERTVRRNLIEPLQEMLGEGVVRVNWGTGIAYLFGKQLELVGGNDARAETKIRGGTFGSLYVDEWTTLPDDLIKMALSRLSVPGARCFGTTNPDSPNSSCKVDYIDRGEQGEIDCRSFHFTLRDNDYLTKQFVHDLEREYTGLWKMRYIDGLWVLAEGVIYDMLDERVHFVDTVPAAIRYYLCIDYGTSAPLSALLVAHARDSFQRDALYVADEWRWDSKKRQRQLTDVEYSQKLRAWVRDKQVTPAYWIVDPSAISFMLQLSRDGVRNVVAGDNEVEDGLRNVAALFSDVRLYMHSKLKSRKGELWDELVSYIWDELKQQRGLDVPLKAFDHGPDALRYGVRTLRPLWRPWVQEALT